MKKSPRVVLDSFTHRRLAGFIMRRNNYLITTAAAAAAVVRPPFEGRWCWMDDALPLPVVFAVDKSYLATAALRT